MSKGKGYRTSIWKFSNDLYPCARNPTWTSSISYCEFLEQEGFQVRVQNLPNHLHAIPASLHPSLHPLSLFSFLSRLPPRLRPNPLHFIMPMTCPHRPTARHHRRPCQPQHAKHYDTLEILPVDYADIHIKRGLLNIFFNSEENGETTKEEFRGNGDLQCTGSKILTSTPGTIFRS